MSSHTTNMIILGSKETHRHADDRVNMDSYRRRRPGYSVKWWALVSLPSAVKGLQMNSYMTGGI
jgi:hypothetical protein